MTNEFDFIKHSAVLTWFFNKALNDPLCVTFLTKGNISVFENLWGAPSGKTGDYTYWKRDYCGITIFVCSNASETVYRVQYLGDYERFLEDNKMGAYCTGFLNSLCNDLLNSN